MIVVFHKICYNLVVKGRKYYERKCIWQKIQIRVTARPGINIATAIQEAIAMSKSQGVEVSFVFNGQEVVVDQNSTLETAYQCWHNKMVDRQEKPKTM